MFMSKRSVVIMAGNPDTGKTVGCHHLEQRGYTPVSVSGLIREYAETHGLPLDERADFRTAHKQMKQERGNEVVVDHILAVPGAKIAVDGLRVWNDVERLRGKVGAQVVALLCPPELRWQRSDSPDLADYLKEEQGDYFSHDPEVQNNAAVLLNADYYIDASQPLAVVIERLDQVITEIETQAPVKEIGL